jgi:Lrp/AsnC family transcriptional regulator for asnA, asnC and gidA
MDESRNGNSIFGDDLQPAAVIELDAIDHKILAQLRDEGRRPNTEIARAIGVSEPTVRKRLDRMLKQGVLKILPVLNAAATGFAMDAVIGISVQTGQLRKVGRELAAIDQVTYVAYVSGRFDIIIEVLLRDQAELFEFIGSVLQRIEGIASSETFNVLHTEKFSYMWLPSEEAGGSLGGSPGRQSDRR